MRIKSIIFAFVSTVYFGLSGIDVAFASCPALPFTITNGQVTDATQIMADYEALRTCLNTGEFVEVPSPTRQFSGPGGGIITMQNPSAATDYNFNLPATAGSAGEFFVSGGGGTAPDAWVSLNGDFQLSGTVLGLGTTSVTPGTYALSSLTVDTKGRITAASNGPTVGSSGHALPYLDGANAWSATQTFGSVVGSVATKSGTAYTLQEDDCGLTLRFTSSSAVTVTTLNSLPAGCAIAVEQAGSGQVTIVPGSGASQHSSHNFSKTFGQYAILGLFIDENAGGSAANVIVTGDGA